jgi:hypothetical protein
MMMMMIKRNKKRERKGEKIKVNIPYGELLLGNCWLWHEGTTSVKGYLFAQKYL